MITALAVSALALQTGKAPSPSQLYRKVAPSVVTIISEKVPPSGLGDPDPSVPVGTVRTSTGFICAPDLIATAKHGVFIQSGKTKVRFANGVEMGKLLVGFIGSSDVLLIRTPRKLSTPTLSEALHLSIEEVVWGLRSTNLKKIQVGDRCYVVGGPLGLESSLTDGIVSAFRLEKEGGPRLIQFTAAISPGSSGSPLLDSHGRVIGVVNSTVTAGQSLNFATAVEELASLKEHDKLYRKTYTYLQLDSP